MSDAQPIGSGRKENTYWTGLTVQRVGIYKVNELRGITKDWEFSKGKGRRLRAIEARGPILPNSMRISQCKHVTHEAVMVGRSLSEYSGTTPSPDVIHAFIAIFSTARGIPRNNGSKCIKIDDQWYYILTWTDLFGVCMREGQFCKHEGNNTILFLQKAEKCHCTLMTSAVEKYMKYAEVKWT